MEMCAPLAAIFLFSWFNKKKMGGNCDSMGPNSGNRNSVSCTHLVDVGEDRRALKNATHTHTYTHHVSLGQSWTIEINVWKSNTFCKRPFAYKPAGERKKKRRIMLVFAGFTSRWRSHSKAGRILEGFAKQMPGVLHTHLHSVTQVSLC